jgi:hypothetical protein
MMSLHCDECHLKHPSALAGPSLTHSRLTRGLHVRVSPNPGDSRLPHAKTNGTHLEEMSCDFRRSRDG